MRERQVIKEKLWSRDFVIVMLACAGISFCNYFFVSTLPILAQNITGTTVYAGLMTTVYTVAALATRPFSGVLTERIGRVKLLIFGAALCAVACFLYQYSTVIIILILVRALQGIGFGVHTTAGGAVPADIVPKSRLAEGLGIFGLYGTIASAVAPAIALSIIGVGDLQSFRPLFIVATIIALLCLVLDTQIRYEKKKKTKLEDSVAAQITDRDDTAPLPKTYLGFEVGVFLPSAVLLLAFIGFSSVPSFLALFAVERNLGNIGLFFTITAAGMFLSRVFLGKVADRRGADTVVIPSLLVSLACLALIPFARQPVFLLILGFPFGFTQGAICPAINVMMFHRCSAKRRGAAAAAYFASIDLGFAIGGALFGFIAEHLGFSVVYWAAAASVAAAAVVYLLCLRKRKTAIKVIGPSEL